MSETIVPFPSVRPHANITADDAVRLRDELYVADSVLAVLFEALISDDQHAHECNTIRVVRERIMAVAEDLDVSVLSGRSTPPEAA